MDKVKGFRDIFPEDMEVRERVFSESDRWAIAFGFKRIDFPSVEFLDLYKLKSGEELVGQSFSFKDKNGRDITLIPEATPTVSRMLASRKELPKPVKWYSIGKFWRYEDPQSGRQREFYQFNADIFGPNSAEADAEVIMLATKILDGLGLESKYEMRVNSRKLMQKLLENLGVKEPVRAFQIIDRFRKITVDDFVEEISPLLAGSSDVAMLVDILSKPVNPDKLSKLSSSRKDLFSGAEDEIARISRTVRDCSSVTKSRVLIDFSVIRGLTYYTGIVFEAFDAMGESRSILGGGRYDGLMSLLSGESIPAVGFAMGDVTLELTMRKNNTWNVPVKKPSIYLCKAPDAEDPELPGIAMQIRYRGISCSTDLYSRSLASQLRDASRTGCGYALIRGAREIKERKISVKNLGSGNQRSIGLDSLNEFLDSIVSLVV